MALTAGTDTSELLGSFEQREPARDRAALEADVLRALRAATTATLVSDPGNGSAREDGCEGGGRGEGSNQGENKKAAVEGVLAVEVAWAAWARYLSSPNPEILHHVDQLPLYPLPLYSFNPKLFL